MCSLSLPNLLFNANNGCIEAQNSLYQGWFIRNGEIAGQTYNNVEIESIHISPYAFNLDGTLIILNEGQMAIWLSLIIFQKHALLPTQSQIEVQALNSGMYLAVF